MDYQIQVVTVPVTDVDQAAAFYTHQAGFALDVDYHPADGFRVVQLTAPGSACSVQIGTGLTDAAPGSARGTYLAVTDIEAAKAELDGKGVRQDGPIRDIPDLVRLLTFYDPDDNALMFYQVTGNG